MRCHGARARLALLAAILAFFSCAVLPARASGPPEERLYLVVVGARDGVVEQYLRATCLKLQRRGARGRYSSARVFREEKVELTALRRRLKADPEHPDGTLINELARFQYALEKRVPECVIGETLAPLDPSAPATLVELEWVSGEAGRHQLRAVKAVMNRPRTGAGRADKQTDVDDPIDLWLSSESPKHIEASARELGVRLLDLPSAELFDPRMSVLAPARSYCHAAQRAPDCVQLGSSLDIGVVLAPTAWHEPHELEARLDVSCHDRSGLPQRTSLSIDLDPQTGVGSSSVLPHWVSTCSVDLEVKSRLGPRSLTLPLRHRVRIEAPPLLLNEDGGAQAQRYDIVWNRLLPWTRAWTNRRELRARLQRLRIATGAEVLAFGEEVRRGLLALEIEEESPSLRERLRGGLAGALHKHADLLGYVLLVGHQETGTLFGATVNNEPRCSSLSREMVELAAVGALSEKLADKWARACVDVIRAARTAFNTRALKRAPRRFALSRHPEEEGEVFRFVPELTEKNRVTVDAGAPLLASKAPGEFRQVERMLIQGTLDDDLQSLALPFSLRATRGEPNVIFRAGVEAVNLGYLPASGSGSWRAGGVASAGFPFFSGALTARVAFDALVGSPREDRFGLRLDLELDAAKTIRQLCFVGVRACWEASFSGGWFVGYDLLRKYPVWGVQFGYGFTVGKMLLEPGMKFWLRPDQLGEGIKPPPGQLASPGSAVRAGGSLLLGVAWLD